MTEKIDDQQLKSDEMHELARRFREAYMARDLAAMAKLYHPDAIIWHNTDCKELSVQRHMETFASNTKSIVSFSYEEVVVHPFVGGFVQRHRSRGVTISGKELYVHTCMVCLVRNGRITRFDEYWDSAALRKADAEPVH